MLQSPSAVQTTTELTRCAFAAGGWCLRSTQRLPTGYLTPLSNADTKRQHQAALQHVAACAHGALAQYNLASQLEAHLEIQVQRDFGCSLDPNGPPVALCQVLDVHQQLGGQSLATALYDGAHHEDVPVLLLLCFGECFGLQRVGLARVFEAAAL